MRFLLLTLFAITYIQLFANPVIELSQSIEIPNDYKQVFLDENGDLDFYNVNILGNNITISEFNLLNTEIIEFTNTEIIYESSIEMYENLHYSKSWQQSNKLFFTFRDEESITDSTEFVLIILDDDDSQIYYLELEPRESFGDFVVLWSFIASSSISNFDFFDTTNSTHVDFFGSENVLALHDYALIDDSKLLVNYLDDEYNSHLKIINLDLEILGYKSIIGEAYVVYRGGFEHNQKIYFYRTYPLVSTAIVEWSLIDNEIIVTNELIDYTEGSFEDIIVISDSTFIFKKKIPGYEQQNVFKCNFNLTYESVVLIQSELANIDLLDFSNDIKLSYMLLENSLVISAYSIENIYQYDTFYFDIEAPDFFKRVEMNDEKVFFFSYGVDELFILKHNSVGLSNDAISFTGVNISNYPNPFNPTTTISFELSQNLENINLEIYNIKGQKVKTLINENMLQGNHQVE